MGSLAFVTCQRLCLTPYPARPPNLYAYQTGSYTCSWQLRSPWENSSGPTTWPTSSETMPNSLEDATAAPGIETWHNGKRRGLYSAECVEGFFCELRPN